MPESKNVGGKEGNVALFPGRFQPPHLGHIITLMRIYPLYTKIIVGVTSYTYHGAKKQVLHPVDVKKILEDALQHLPKFHVTVIGRGMIEREDYSDLPPFDVVVTGNLQTISRLRRYNVKTRYVPRSKGVPGWSGTELRGALQWH